MAIVRCLFHLLGWIAKLLSSQHRIDVLRIGYQWSVCKDLFPGPGTESVGPSGSKRKFVARHSASAKLLDCSIDRDLNHVHDLVDPLGFAILVDQNLAYCSGCLSCLRKISLLLPDLSD